MKSNKCDSDKTSDNSNECNGNGNGDGSGSDNSHNLDYDHHRNYQELISLLDNLDNSIRDLERLREELHQVSINIFAPEYLQSQYREARVLLDQSIAKKRREATLWRLWVIQHEATRLCAQNWASLLDVKI